MFLGYCFLPGCENKADEHVSTRIVRRIPTKGKFGGSHADMSFDFCSPQCANIFLREYPTLASLVNIIWELSVDLDKESKALP